MKIIVIGGGIIGITTALECAWSGAQVTVVERHNLGCGSTGAAGGILTPLYPWRTAPAVAELLALSGQRWAVLLDRLTFRREITPPQGLLCLDKDEYQSAAGWARENGWAYEQYDREQLRELAPHLNTDGGFFLREVRSIDPSELLSALRDSLHKASVQVIEHTPVRSIVADRRQATGVLSDDGVIEGDCVIVCAGAWSAKLCAGLAIRPVRGQMIEYACRGREPMLNQILIAEGNYLIPRGRRLLVGSTVEDCGFDNAVTEQARAELSRFAERYLPSLKDFSVARQWSGLRPGIDRPAPYIGWHPELQDLFVNAGHYRNGIALAAGAAYLSAQMLHRRTPELNPALFALSKAH